MLLVSPTKKKCYYFDMNEIEIKARVADTDSVRKKLDSFATYLGAVIRDDTYYAHPKIERKIRFRKETRGNQVQWLATYKRKENKISPDGITTEVNEELETSIDDPFPLIKFLEDSGYKIHLQKHKEVYDWKFGDATIELCQVPPLGWFLEIEILSKKNDPATLDGIQRELKSILTKTGLNEKDIETKYYSQLLREQVNP